VPAGQAGELLVRPIEPEIMSKGLSVCMKLRWNQDATCGFTQLTFSKITT